MIKLERNIIDINGVVQGVGFRPFVYTLATQLNITGSVLNTGHGVHIEIEGTQQKLDLFLIRLQNELPPLAQINQIKKVHKKPQGDHSFVIQESNQSQKTALISPDISICDQCLTEFHDPHDKRYQYFAINCTHCGPRYSIIETVPYDRAFTSMKFFTMCQACEREYHDPLDRRYHAQPISCYACGPTLTLYDFKDQKIDNQNLIQKVATLFNQGAIIAVKGLGGFHLMCDGYNDESIAWLRQRKNRPLKPLALLFPTIEAIEKNSEVTPFEKEIILSKEKPIVLVSKKTETKIAPNIAPGIDRIGVMLPYTPLHYLIFNYFKNPLVATSANLSNEPIIRTKKELVQKLGNVVDYILDFDREIVNSIDDSVVQMIDQRPLFLRLARGFTPKSITLPFTLNKNILAVGAEQKNTIALAFGNQVILSPYIGDLTSIEAFDYFERTLQTFKRFYDFIPDLIVCDKHPEYATTLWAQKQKIPVVQVQHHHAHILSVMLEQAIHGQVLGIAFDGTGYGDDHTLWGGEFLLCGDDRSFDRVASFKPLVLLGGDKAIKEPRRIALAMAFEVMDLESVKKTKIADWFSTTELTLLHQAYQKKINTIQTSSVGRIFDGVASLLEIVHLLSYEGESGLKMEQYYDEQISDHFRFKINNGIIDYDPMISGLIQEDNLRKGVSMFFNTLIEIIVSIAHSQNLPLVMSGGIFQNRVLVGLLLKRLEKEGIKYYFPQNITPNDSSIALGQIAYAIRYSR